MSIVFGPVPSRRLRRSLGINNIPPKVCSYSCVYCQVGLTTNMTIERRDFYSPMIIYAEVKNRLDELKLKGEEIDYISFVPDGEPVLDKNLEDTIVLLQDLGVKIAVFTNSSLTWKKEVRNALSMADYVSFKIDAVNEITWRKINRPLRQLSLDKILDGISEFGVNYKGRLVTETMLIDGLNDNEDDLIKIIHYIVKLRPATAYLTLPVRPVPVKGIKAPPMDKVESSYRIIKSIYPDTELLSSSGEDNYFTGSRTVENLLSILAVHPMKKNEVERFLADAGLGWDTIISLLNEEKIKEVRYDGNTYFRKENIKSTSLTNN
jgi:wyosine [tRNA(Phe)-imidazoG37] synthetase (radical SAM superfamily)